MVYAQRYNIASTDGGFGNYAQKPVLDKVSQAVRTDPRNQYAEHLSFKFVGAEHALCCLFESCCVWPNFIVHSAWNSVSVHGKLRVPQKPSLSYLCRCYLIHFFKGLLQKMQRSS